MLRRRMSAYELELDGTRAPDVVVSLSGELDLTNAREVEERLRGVAPDGGTLVVDLDRVVFIDSAAIHVLFRLARDFPPEGLALVVGPDAAIARILEIVSLKDACRVLTSREPLEHARSA
jgi:anti-anti-sigma factor